MLGDIVISVETAARQAEERGHTVLDEIRILMVGSTVYSSILHITTACSMFSHYLLLNILLTTSWLPTILAFFLFLLFILCMQI